MEKVDLELLLRIAPTNVRLQKLYKEHVELEERLNELERCRAVSSFATGQASELKKQKLRGMDDIMSILNEYRHNKETISYYQN